MLSGVPSSHPQRIGGVGAVGGGGGDVPMLIPMLIPMLVPEGDGGATVDWVDGGSRVVGVGGAGVVTAGHAPASGKPATDKAPKLWPTNSGLEHDV